MTTRLDGTKKSQPGTDASLVSRMQLKMDKMEKLELIYFKWTTNNSVSASSEKAPKIIEPGVPSTFTK